MLFKSRFTFTFTVLASKGGSRVGERVEVEARRELRLGGVPHPTRRGLGRGLCPLPRKILEFFIPKWRIFVHSAAVILG